METIKEATGAAIRPHDLSYETILYASDFGAAPKKSAVENTQAINQAILAASKQGGATVVIAKGEYRTYTIELKSHVHLHFEEGAVIRAARTDIKHSYVNQDGEGGNYLEPEINRFAGLQDHGHSYFANSLFYGADLCDIMISGDGLIDGSSWNEEEKCREYVLLGGDPSEPAFRNEKGHNGEWFGNKAIALVRCKNVVLTDFSLVIGGHFAIIAEGVENMYVDGILIDTNRDAFDVDCCKDVTVRNSVFNSLTDDGLVMKSSYGAGIFMPLENVLIEDCKVSGYDAGSVYAKTYTNEKLVAEDRCGPTGRVKLGTESSCGYHQVTVRRVDFEHSRGFALEAVDGSDLTDIIFEDSHMKYISSSPIFIRVGDRCRFPVTGMQMSEEIQAKAPNIRLDNRGFVIPDNEHYPVIPAVRYTPSYNKTKLVSVDGRSFFTVVDEENPVTLNQANLVKEDGVTYGKIYVAGEGYVADRTKALDAPEAASRANGCSRPLAKVKNIRIARVSAESVDPRYPILLAGLDGSNIENVQLEDIKVTYRGGLTMEHATEQRQLNTNWEYTQYQTKPSIQSLPWLVNTFFLKNEGLLPRVDWDEKTKSWKDDPYNVPELPTSYPEPSIFGILPAYGFYARHVKGLEVKGLSIGFEKEDTRHAIVLDDVADASFEDLSLQTAKETQEVAFVTSMYKRPANLEYVPDQPYHMTTITNVTLPENISVKLATVEAPAPGTPRDSFYSCPTLPIPENGYRYQKETDVYPLPLTVFPPFENRTTGKTRNPAEETSCKEVPGMIYNEGLAQREYTVYRDHGKHVSVIMKKMTKEQVGEIAAVERACFLPAEAASEKDFEERFSSPAFVCYGAYNEEGELIGFIDGASYDKPELPDELYHDTTKLVENGPWQTVFGVNVIARYRRMGVAGQMVRHYVEESRKRGQDGVVLTCKDHLRPLYEKAGFIWQGVSASTHGGVKWNDMLLRFRKGE